MPNGGTRTYRIFRITRDGFVFLAMGFTGKEAAQWKEAYITAFNKMEAQLSTNPLPLPSIKAIPRRPSNLPRPDSIPPEVQPLLDATVWRLVGRAHADISDWVERNLAYSVNLTYAGNADTRAQRARQWLEAVIYEN